MLVDQDKAAVN